MRGFEYARPATVEQAVRLLAAEPGGSVALAGGSDLLALMKDGVEKPARVVSLRGLGGGPAASGAGLAAVRTAPGGGLRIGALSTIDQAAGDAALRRAHPVLATALSHVAAPQIRHVGTVGGNLLQRPRCWYFRNGYGLLPRQDGRSMVVEGDNRFHAILGATDFAWFVHPSTVAPLLIALGAQLTVAGPQGVRQLDLAKLYRVPAREGEREHALGPGELVTEIAVPPLGGRKVWSYEVRRGQSLDWSLATAAVALEMQGGRIGRARVVLGQVAPVPWTAAAAEELLRGRALDAATAAEAGEAAVAGAHALSRNRYKIDLARVAVKRALLAAAGLEGTA
jgi:xanthine dehydrogenase YagS FAD-binding subunit